MTLAKRRARRMSRGSGGFLLRENDTGKRRAAGSSGAAGRRFFQRASGSGPECFTGCGQLSFYGCRGGALGGKRMDLRNITMPVLNIFAEEDHLVPPASTLALKDHVGTDDYSVLSYPVGMYVSGKVQRDLPPAIVKWLKARGGHTRVNTMPNTHVIEELVQ